MANYGRKEIVMKDGAKTHWYQEKNRGSAVVMLLIIVGLVVLVYLGKLWVKKRTPDPDLTHNLPVWKEWRLREKSTKEPAQVSEEQPQITNVLSYKASVDLKGTREQRGDISITITPDGSVFGDWKGNYWRDSKDNFDGGGSFEGKTYPAKIYTDPNGQDPSKLYFLAKGQFILHQSDLKKKYRIRGGDIYVNGWIGTDYFVGSEITITSDEKYFETFIWSGKPAEDASDGLMEMLRGGV
jgi:hypothetical protein